MLDNGVGKSFTAKTIAESLFQYGNPSSGDFEGFLYLRGEHYQVICTPFVTQILSILQGLEHLEEYRQTITRSIFSERLRIVYYIFSGCQGLSTSSYSAPIV